MRFGCCMGLATFLVPSTSRGILLKSLTFQEKLAKIPVIMEALEKNGFEFVEAEVSLLSPEGNQEEFTLFKEKISPFYIKPEVFSAFIPPELKIVGPSVDRKRLERYLESSISKVAEVGGKVIIWGSGTSRSFPTHYPPEIAYKQIEEFLFWAAEFARKNGITLAIEHMNKRESNTINSLREALALREKVNREEIQVMLDFDHLMAENEDFSSIEKCQGKIIHIHVSDRGRRCPGDGDYPFIYLFKILKKIRFQERISLECSFQEIEKQSKQGLTLLRKIWEQA